MAEQQPEEQSTEEPEIEEGAVDDLERKLLEAMKDLTRKSKKVEEYLDGLAKPDKPAPQSDAPPSP
ncbi:MAG: hypothetical protein Kow0099_33560 [Candidatus Abyssubacteria bacterium]